MRRAGTTTNRASGCRPYTMPVAYVAHDFWVDTEDLKLPLPEARTSSSSRVRGQESAHSTCNRQGACFA